MIGSYSISDHPDLIYVGTIYGTFLILNCIKSDSGHGYPKRRIQPVPVFIIGKTRTACPERSQMGTVV